MQSDYQYSQQDLNNFSKQLRRCKSIVTLGSEADGLSSVSETILKKCGLLNYRLADSLDKCAQKILSGEADGMVVPALHTRYSQIITECDLNPVASITMAIPDIVLVGKTAFPAEKVLGVYALDVHKPLIQQVFQCGPHAISCTSTVHALNSFISHGNTHGDCCITNDVAYHEAIKNHPLYIWRKLKANYNGVFILVEKKGNSL